MLNVICERCGGRRDVHFNRRDTFTWQCPKCNMKNTHKGQKSSTIKTKKEPPSIFPEEKEFVTDLLTNGDTIEANVGTEGTKEE